MQLLAAKALQCQRQPSCFPKAVHERIHKLDKLLGESRIEPPHEAPKAREQRVRVQIEIIQERERLRSML